MHMNNVVYFFLHETECEPSYSIIYEGNKIGPVHNLLHHVVETVTLGLILAGEKERKSIVFGLRCSLKNVEPENCSEHCSLDFSGFRFFVTVC